MSFPPRLTPQGTFATTPYGSDEAVDEAIAVLTLTRVGERIMVPDYGIHDPVFAGLTIGDIQTGISEYGPEGVAIESLDETPISETRSRYIAEWSREAPSMEAL